MDSLLANYASSDEEEQQQPPNPIPSKTTSSSSSNTTSSFFSSLPKPKSSESPSTLQSLSQPNQSSINPSSITHKSSSLFSSLPNPKSQIQQQPKRVVQFRPPVIPLPKPTDLDDDDDVEEEKERIRRRNSESSIQTPSVKSFLSSIPAPRNATTLGVQSSSGSGRRSIIETEASEPAPAPAPVSVSAAESDVAVDQNAGEYATYENYPNYQYVTDPNSEDHVSYENYPNYQYATDPNAGSGFSSYGNYDSGVDHSDSSVVQSVEAGSASYASVNDAYGSYSGYGDNVQYGNNWVDGLPEASGASDNAIKFPGKKRGRNEIPIEVIEVKQEELIKNRPREDQVKLTGVAFGPSYQPVSAKGKPSKLHKRKHQISSLYFDMKQNEMQLAERRSKGMLTKAETQAKYGW
ncbi:PREDICTED: proline-rich protein PRCC-like isoform X2 [Lupinus angustifolius]|uniref:proline-rich protein PRCC-like isoform X2 n=1 Tax=Lupinus angustifolius TaxID=3871 RepID=UPI00092F5588|nr:PREDICTED: proline-rich protein PRCC-like isoform X2 [Lupinus angustifolius]